jgi:hypothetical protein
MYPSWRSDGGELVYSDLEGMITAVPVSFDSEAIRVGKAEQLFRIDPPRPPNPVFAPSPDLARFVVSPSGVAAAENTLNLVVNWPAKLANDG